MKLEEAGMSEIYRKKAYPFEHIAVAVSFSPRLLGVLAEAFRMVVKFGANKLVIIHIGAWSEEQEHSLETKIKEANKTNEDFVIIHKESSAVESNILEICKEQLIDLLVIGALRKENIFDYYMGSIARNLSRRAKCSLLMLTEPSENPIPFERIVVNGIENSKTIPTIETALYLAENESAEEIFVVSEVYLPLMDAGLTDATDEESDDIKKKYLDEAISKSGEALRTIKGFKDILIKKRTIHGKPGYSIRNFAKNYQADLLIINSPDKKMGFLDRVFTHDLEHLLSRIPCNLLIVHSRRN